MTKDKGPARKRLSRSDYEDELARLEVELVKLQGFIKTAGLKVVVVFEGRDTAGKGGTIKRITYRLNPRVARVVALGTPTEREQSQWYYQRYVPQLPAAGEIVLFDRSWYNRAGVERVMGYCNEQQLAKFLRSAPRFEDMLVDDGIRFFKFFLTIGQEMQLKRFHKRRHSRLKRWKLTPNDIASIPKWDAYTEAIRETFERSHSDHAPWTIVRSDDKKRARLAAIRAVLQGIDYAGKGDLSAPDDKICGGPGHWDA